MSRNFGVQEARLRERALRVEQMRERALREEQERHRVSVGRRQVGTTT